MTPEKETELFAMLDTLLAMGKAQGEQLGVQGERLNAQGDQLKAQGDQLRTQGDQIKAQGEQLNELRLGQNRLDARLNGLANDIQGVQVGFGRLEGQLSIIVQWMNSMDQRFTALMSPYMPPRKPAA